MTRVRLYNSSASMSLHFSILELETQNHTAGIELKSKHGGVGLADGDIVEVVGGFGPLGARGPPTREQDEEERLDSEELSHHGEREGAKDKKEKRRRAGAPGAGEHVWATPPKRGRIGDLSAHLYNDVL